MGVRVPLGARAVSSMEERRVHTPVMEVRFLHGLLRTNPKRPRDQTVNLVTSGFESRRPPRQDDPRGMGAVRKTVVSARLVRFQHLAPRAYGPEDRTPAPEAGYAGSSPAGRTPRLIVQGTARLRPKEQAGVRIVLSRPDARARSCPLSLATRPMSTVADELRPESRKPSGTEVVEARARRHVIGQQVSVVKRPGTGVRDCVVTAIERELIRQRRDQRQRVPGLGQCELGWPRALQTPAPPHRRTRPLGTAPRRNRRLGSRHLDLRRNRPHLRPRRRMRARARLSRPCPLSLGRWPIRYRPIRWEE